LVLVLHIVHLNSIRNGAKLGITFEGFLIFGMDVYTVVVEWVLCRLKLPG
jgi:hypothetical protein